MDIDAKLGLCNQAYDAIGELREIINKEGKTDLYRRASEICQKILLLNIAISVDDEEE